MYRQRATFPNSRSARLSGAAERSHRQCFDRQIELSSCDARANGSGTLMAFSDRASLLVQDAGALDERVARAPVEECETERHRNVDLVEPGLRAPHATRRLTKIGYCARRFARWRVFTQWAAEYEGWGDHRLRHRRREISRERQYGPATATALRLTMSWISSTSRGRGGSLAFARCRRVSAIGRRSFACRTDDGRGRCIGGAWAIACRRGPAGCAGRLPSRGSFPVRCWPILKASIGPCTAWRSIPSWRPIATVRTRFLPRGRPRR